MKRTIEPLAVDNSEQNLQRREDRKNAMLTAFDVMTTNVITVTPETSVKDTARLLYTERISGVPVMDVDGQVIGIISENDLIRHVEVTGEPRRSWLAALLTDDSTLAREYGKN